MADSDSDSETLATIPRHVEIAYKDAIDNLVFGKRETVVYTNYVLAGYAGLLFVFKGYVLSGGPTNGARCLGIGLTGLLLVYHFIVMVLIQRWMVRLRRRLHWIYASYFTAAEKNGLRVGYWPAEFFKRPDSVVFAGGLMMISLIAACFVVYLLAVHVPART
jgi:hypothetical protein